MKLLVTVLMYFAVATLVACSLTSCGQATNPILSSSEGYDTLPSWTSLKQEMMEDSSFERGTAMDGFDDAIDTVNSIRLADETFFYLNEYDGMMTLTSWNYSLFWSIIEDMDTAGVESYIEYTFLDKDTLYRVSWTYPQFIPRVPDL